MSLVTSYSNSVLASICFWYWSHSLPLFTNDFSSRYSAKLSNNGRQPKYWCVFDSVLMFFFLISNPELKCGTLLHKCENFDAFFLAYPSNIWQNTHALATLTHAPASTSSFLLFEAVFCHLLRTCSSRTGKRAYFFAFGNRLKSNFISHSQRVLYRFSWH